MKRQPIICVIRCSPKGYRHEVIDEYGRFAFWMWGYIAAQDRAKHMGMTEVPLNSKVGRWILVERAKA